MSDFTTTDGRVECDSCDWWVPKGMEYLKDEHECDGYAGPGPGKFKELNPTAEELFDHE